MYSVLIPYIVLKGGVHVTVLECPWCGMSGDLEFQSTPEGFFYVQVRCSNGRCRALSPHGLFSTEKMSMKQAEKKAVEKWNKRAPKRGV